MAEPEYVVVGRLEDLPSGARRAVVVDGHQVLVLNVDGELYAVPEACPHRAWPLSQADLRETVLKCARHRWEFDVPSGRGVFPPFGYRLRHLPLRVVDDVVQVAWVDAQVEAAH